MRFEGKGGTLFIAFGRVIVYHIEYHLDACLV